jgi:hypothetical protein
MFDLSNSQYTTVELAKQRHSELLATSRRGDFGISRPVRAIRRAIGRRMISWGQQILNAEKDYRVGALAR